MREALINIEKLAQHIKNKKNNEKLNKNIDKL